jgi:hypothetical protein
MPTGNWGIWARGGGDSSTLTGCRIVGTSTGYDLSGSGVRASSTSLSAPITFTFTGPRGFQWTVTIDSFDSAGRPSGGWYNTNRNPETQVGSWSADTGMDEEAAASDIEATTEAETGSSAVGTDAEAAASAT